MRTSISSCPSLRIDRPVYTSWSERTGVKKNSSPPAFNNGTAARLAGASMRTAAATRGPVANGFGRSAGSTDNLKYPWRRPPPVPRIAVQSRSSMAWGRIRIVNPGAISIPSVSNAVAVTTAVLSEALISVMTVLYPLPMTK